MKLQHLYNPKVNDIGNDHLEFIASMAGPTVIHLTGEDPSRCRVLVTLLHANEPSGFKAIHRLLAQQVTPKTSFKIIIASVIAARTEPVFTHRMLAGQRDLNRCFAANDVAAAQQDSQGKLALAMTEFIQQVQPEAIIDLHNTSGSGPAFCVSVTEQIQHQALATLFVPRLIKTDIRLGAIMECDFGCPIITVEAGGSQDAAADEAAYHGVRRFMCEDNVFAIQQSVDIIRQPRRLEIKPDVSIGYSDTPNPMQHITMRQDIEKLNFGVTAGNQLLGWINQGNLEQLRLDNEHYDIHDFFVLDQGNLMTRQALQLFMVTTRPDIAKSDCLFYFAIPETHS